MRKKLSPKAAAYLERKRQHLLWMKIVSILVCIVVLCTVYVLILPAITLEKKADVSGEGTKLICSPEIEAHTHTEDCYSRVQGELICGQEASEEHQHGDECYRWETVLVCGKDEIILHTHSKTCYDEGGQLVCGQTEIREHVHEDACFEQSEERETESEEKEVEGIEGTLTCAGEDYTISVAYGADARIPENAELRVTEYEKDSEIYQQRYDNARELYGWKEDKTDRVRLFDVSFYVNDAEIEPAEAVNVTIACDGWTDQNQYTITHFVNDGEPETISNIQISDVQILDGESGAGEQSISFVLNSFSQIQILADMEEFAENTVGQYAIVNINIAGSNISTGAKGAMLAETYKGEKESMIKSENIGTQYYEKAYSIMLADTEEKLDNFQSRYQVWRFEPIDGAPENPYESKANQYYIYAQDTADSKKYLTINSNSIKLESEPTDNSKITVTVGTGNFEGMVRLTNKDGMAANLYGGTISRGFGPWNGNDKNEWLVLCQMQLLDADSIGTSEGISPTGTVINLFDYWTTERYPQGGDYGEGNKLDNGINQNHTLKFFRDGLAGINKWTGSAAVYPNIVQKSLVNGYPALNNEVTNSSESLAYLFDPEAENAYRQVFRGVKGLLQTNDAGYYYYNSQENFAEFNEETNRITLYDHWGVVTGGNGPNGQFFPFNSFRDNILSKSTGASMNHYFGMTLTARFVQRYDGYTDSSRQKATIFEFSGDDDVWIFVDDVLVADLGGVHDAASVKIDFASGMVSINEKDTHTIYSAFDAAGKTENTQWITNSSGTQIFDNETYHTLKFYYLERGNYDSNLKLMYNLTEIPVTSINKVDQYGEKVSGARFAVYAANGQYNYLSDLGGQAVTLTDNYYFGENGDIIDSGNGDILVKARYIGTTDSSGQMIFKDADEMPYTLNDLQRMFGEYFILREVHVPDGYRLVKDEIYLKNTGKMLLCENSYESGVNASSTLMVVATDTLYLAKGGTQHFYDPENSTPPEGTLFAVVMKYTGEGADGLTKQNNWVPVFGDDKDGYKVVEPNGDLIQAAITAAKGSKALNQEVEFSAAMNGTMQLNMKHLPGSIANYYYMLGDSQKDQTEYTIAYYWTEAGSLEGATSQNTFRVLADKDESTGNNGFDRAFGSTISVPNVNNRFFVQKFDEDGKTLLNGAAFAMYRVDSDRGQTYYIADGDDGIGILLGQNEGDNTGTAWKRNSNEEFEYRVDASNGVITVGKLDEDGNFTTEYMISPAVNAKGESVFAATVSGSENGVGEDGTLSFSNLQDGLYCLREVSAPDGYKINVTETLVSVNGDAIYVDAGEADDGVTVGSGPGYVLATMRQFASDGDIDKTLTWIYTMLRVSEGSGIPIGDYKTWPYATGLTESSADPQDALRTYFKYDAASGDEKDAIFNYILNTEKKGTGTRRLYTDVGWSYLEVYQDYAYKETAEASGANYDNLKDIDISKIFSRSIYVRVIDQRTGGELRISKIVENKAEDTTEFQFNVTLTDKNGTTLEDDYPYRVETADDSGTGANGTVSSGTIVKGSGSITLRHGQTAVIQGIPAGTRYTVTEAKSEDYSTSAARDKGKTKADEAADDTGEKIYVFDTIAGEACTVSGQLYWKVGADGFVDRTSTVDYVNSFLPDITILKYQSGTNGAGRVTLPGAQFVFYYTVVGDNNIETKYYYSEIGWTTTETILTTSSDESTKGMIELSGLPDGEYILKEKKAPDGYNCMTEDIRITISGGKIEAAAPVGEVGFSEDKLTLYVPNSTGYKLPEAGGMGTTLLYVIGGILAAGATILLITKKRSSRENCP